MSFETPSLTYAAEGLEKGEWLRGLFVSIVAALGCDVCGYGHDNAYSAGYVPLLPEKVLERLRAGELFTIGYPNFQAISVDLVSPDEMNALWAQLPRSKYLKYELAASGYHILSIIP